MTSQITAVKMLERMQEIQSSYQSTRDYTNLALEMMEMREVLGNPRGFATLSNEYKKAIDIYNQLGREFKNSEERAVWELSHPLRY